ncbi:MAG: T9SS type A sorting domain-containing protein [Flavobacteriales bacterium]
MKILPFLFSFLCSIALHSQPLPLEFELFDEDYNTLMNDTVFSDEDWDDGYWQIPIGFDFHYMEQVYDYVYFFGPFGGFGSELCMGEYVKDGTYDMLCPALIDVKDAPGDELSTMSYVTEGTAPSRIFKLQWANCAIVGDKSNEMRVNYQMWFYETSNCVQFRYGPSVSFNVSITGFIGVPAFLGNNWNSVATGNNCTGLWNMTGDVNDPDFNFSFGSDDLFIEPHLDELPAESTVFSFCGDSSTSVHEIETIVLVFPNPASEVLQLRSEQNIEMLQLFDCTGRVVVTETVRTGRYELGISSLPSGLYSIRLQMANGVVMKEFVKL